MTLAFSANPELQIRLWDYMGKGGRPSVWIAEARARGFVLADDNGPLEMLADWRERGWYDYATKLDEGWLTARGALGAEWDPWPKPTRERATAATAKVTDGKVRRLRPRGSGCVVRRGSTWKWEVEIAGTYHWSPETFDTEEAAYAALDAFVARRLGTPAPVTIAPLKLAQAAEDDGSSPRLPMGQGWGKPDSNGLCKHLSCNGRGCAECKEQGYGRAQLRAKAAAR